MKEQQGDVLLCQTNDGGDIEVENGVVTMAGGLSTAVYLSLFGGNERDDGRDGNSRNWWGNIGEQPESQYRSETGHLLQSIPATSGNLRRIEDAVLRDLAVFVEIGAATEVFAEASIPAVNAVQIVAGLKAEFGPVSFTFKENWVAET